MTAITEIDPELLPILIQEAEELLPQIRHTLNTLHHYQNDDPQLRHLRRALHTFKGSARMAGAYHLGQIIHHLEDLVQQQTQQSLPLGSNATLLALHDIESVVAQLHRLSNALPESTSIDAQHHVAFSSICKRLFNIVQQTCKALGKEVQLQLKGEEVILNQQLLNRLTPPLEHLIRNAIAHGVELPHQRQRLGKPAAGQIHLSLRKESEESVLEICDDGAGLDLKSLRQLASTLGYPPDLSDEQAMQLIFVPGLSTAAQIDEIAGRGIGMDDVNSEITALGGSIQLYSESGKGVRFILRIPAATE